MLDDIVQEVKALVESLVSSKLKQVQQDIEELKRGLNSLSKDIRDNTGKALLHTLEATLDSTVTRYANTLKQWTGKATASVVYDSYVCPFTDECLFQMVKDKPNVAIVATTTEGDVFGGFYNVAVTEQKEWFKDPNMFIFSFESNGRCERPQRFVLKEENGDKAHVYFNKNHSKGRFVTLAAFRTSFFCLGNENSYTFCQDMSKGFDGIADTTLTGNLYPAKFTCTRIVAIELN